MTRKAPWSSRSNRPRRSPAGSWTPTAIRSRARPSGPTPNPAGISRLSLPQIASDKDGKFTVPNVPDRMRLLAGGRERGDDQATAVRLRPACGGPTGRDHGRRRHPVQGRLTNQRIIPTGSPIPMNPSRWSPYRPSPSAPWDLARAWTLRRRAGFAATWDELQRDLDDGPDAAVDRVLAGTCRTEGVPADFAVDGRPARRRSRRRQRHPPAPGLVALPDALHARPLTERLTLIWHNHFATSQLKVDDVDGDAPAERDLSPPWPRAVRRPAAGDAPRPRPARLARRPVEPQGQAEREPRPRADGAVHARRRPFLRARREGGRAGADRPDGRPGPICRPTGLARRYAQDDPGEEPTASTATSSPTCCSSSPPRHDGWPGGCASRSWARTSPTSPPSRSWPSDCEADGLHVGRAVEMILRSELFFSARNLHAQVSEPVAFADRHGAEPRALRPATEHALARRVDRPPGPGAVLPAQRGRLAGRSKLAVGALGRGPGQLRGGPRRAAA